MNLRLENLHYSVGGTDFHYHVILKDSITGVFGPSGSGKTTLMNLISGLALPRSGRIVFNETVFFDSQSAIHVPENRRNIGVVFQANDLFPHLSVKRNLDYSRPYIKTRRQFIAFDPVVDLLELRPFLNKRPAQLSGGERQRVAIGRALLSQPELLLLDEPFSNLDRQRREQIISYLLKINDQFQLPLFIISHDLEDILKLTATLMVVQNHAVAAHDRYLTLVESGAAPDIISPKNLLNIFELYFIPQTGPAKLQGFGPKGARLPMLHLTSSKFPASMAPQQKVRFCIEPDDIALTLLPVPDISIRNQLEGKIAKMHFQNGSCFVTVDCGILLVTAITAASAEKLSLKQGQTVYCLIKSKAIDIVHIYSSPKEAD